MIPETLFPHFIDSQSVAVRIADATYGEDDALALEIVTHSRLCEALYFIAWVSSPANHAGGLNRFAAEFIEESLDMFGPEDMSAVASKASFKARSEFAKALPWAVQSELEVADVVSEFWLTDSDPWAYRYTEEGLQRSAQRREKEAEEIEQRRINDRRREVAIRDLTPEKVRAACIKIISECLPNHLRKACTEKGQSFCIVRGDNKRPLDASHSLQCFDRFAKAFFRFMDRWQEKRRAEIAETAVSREVFRWLRICGETRDPVRIEGNSRFGKTESLRTFAAMQPGRARLIDTPHAGGEGELLRAVADALGMCANPKARTGELRRDIDFILKHSQFVLIFDEAQRIFPEKLSGHTQPHKLDWIRRNLIDKRIAAAFVSTPQTFRAAQRQLVKATGYQMQQWDGRFPKIVYLPDKVSREDLLAIASIHFAGVDAHYLEYVVRLASATERSYTSDVAAIARLARIYAREAGRAEIEMPDIKAAIADVLPSVSPESAPPVDDLPAPARLSGNQSDQVAFCEPPARALQPTCTPISSSKPNSKSTRRSVTPAGAFEPA